METKTLKTIQTLSKIGRVLSKIIKICCIVGASGCLVGLITLAAGNFEAIKVGGVTVHGLIEASAGMSMGTIYATVTVGLIFCIAECVIAGISEKYFKNEIAAGTPFTMEGAKQMLTFGICTIAISLGAEIIAAIAYGIFNFMMPNVADMKFDGENQVAVGIAIILMSVICKYGAEVEARSAAAEACCAATDGCSATEACCVAAEAGSTVVEASSAVAEVTGTEMEVSSAEPAEKQN